MEWNTDTDTQAHRHTDTHTHIMLERCTLAPPHACRHELHTHAYATKLELGLILFFEDAILPIYLSYSFADTWPLNLRSRR